MITERFGPNGETFHEFYERTQARTEQEKTWTPKGNDPISWRERGVNYDDYLIGEGFIERGTAGLLAGPSGIGKSSIAIQKAVLWAIGKAAFDLDPARALRIVLTQTEDSDNDIVKQLAVMDALALSETEKKTLGGNLWIETLRGKTGPRAIQEWSQLCRWFKADLLMVNPLSAYFQGDISSNEDNQAFLYGLLGAMLTELRVGFFSMHHKTKPSKNREDLPYHEKMYDMLGGSVLTNFHRAIILVDPIGDSDVYQFTLAKRFAESGWITKSQMFRWHEDQSKRLWIHASVAESDAAKAKGNARADLIALVPVTGAIQKCVLEDRASAHFTQKKFRAVLADCLDDSTPDHERLYEAKMKNPSGGPKTYISRLPNFDN
jgi:hypothetical protein